MTLSGLQHRHAPRRGLVQRLAHRIVEHGDVDAAVGARHADRRGEGADRLRRHAAPAQARDGRHARIVPARHVAVAHQRRQHALGEHRVVHVEPRELDLPRPRGHRQVVEQPVVERLVVGEFQRAQRVRHALDRVRLAVGEVVARIDAPGVAGARMGGVQDAVEHRIAQVDVARRHVDLGAQHAGAVRKLAGAHAAEEIEVLLDRALAERAVRCRPRSACRARRASPPALWSST